MFPIGCLWSRYFGCLCLRTKLELQGIMRQAKHSPLFKTCASNTRRSLAAWQLCAILIQCIYLKEGLLWWRRGRVFVSGAADPVRIPGRMFFWKISAPDLFSNTLLVLHFLFNLSKSRTSNLLSSSSFCWSCAQIIHWYLWVFVYQLFCRVRSGLGRFLLKRALC